MKNSIFILFFLGYKLKKILPVENLFDGEKMNLKGRGDDRDTQYIPLDDYYLMSVCFPFRVW